MKSRYRQMTGRRVRILYGERAVLRRLVRVMQIDCDGSVMHIACLQQTISEPDTKHACGKVRHNLF
jgi:hypothetical protein